VRVKYALTNFALAYLALAKFLLTIFADTEFGLAEFALTKFTIGKIALAINLHSSKLPIKLDLIGKFDQIYNCDRLKNFIVENL
jgi:hypothetical protein